MLQIKKNLAIKVYAGLPPLFFSVITVISGHIPTLPFKPKEVANRRKL